MPPQTDLLDLNPVPRSALNNKLYEGLYTFSHFNPIQSQTFHALYHTDVNILVGAPTGTLYSTVVMIPCQGNYDY